MNNNTRRKYQPLNQGNNHNNNKDNPIFQSKKACIAAFVLICLALLGIAYLASRFRSILVKEDGVVIKDHPSNKAKSTKSPTLSSEEDDAVVVYNNETEFKDDGIHQFYTNLRELKCLPKVCTQKPRIIHNAKEWDGGIYEFLLLVSYPGSGNTWIREVVRDGTRVQPGSVYSDPALEDDGFPGDELQPFAKQWCPVSVIKSHWPVFSELYGLNPKITAAIHIIRSPLDASLSEFNREFGSGHTGVPPPGAFAKHWNGWIKKRHARWKRTMQSWTIERYWDLKNEYKKTKSGVSWFILQKPLLKPDNRNVTVLNLFYEDFITDFVTTSKVLFDFLKPRLKNLMPSTLETVSCALYATQRHVEDEFHRDSITAPKKANPFRTPEGNATAITKWLCDLYSDFWEIEKWGDCYSGMVQKQRKIPIRKAPIIPITPCEE